MSYIIYNEADKILRVVNCSKAMSKIQAKEEAGEFMMEGEADSATQKIVDGEVVDKTPGEIKADNPPLPTIPEGQQQAHITNEQWQNVLDRLRALEGD